VSRPPDGGGPVPADSFRIQAAADRRFNQRKYDVKTIEAFSGQLR